MLMHVYMLKIYVQMHTHLKLCMVYVLLHIARVNTEIYAHKYTLHITHKAAMFEGVYACVYT